MEQFHSSSCRAADPVDLLGSHHHYPNVRMQNFLSLENRNSRYARRDINAYRCQPLDSGGYSSRPRLSTPSTIQYTRDNHVRTWDLVAMGDLHCENMRYARDCSDTIYPSSEYMSHWLVHEP